MEGSEDAILLIESFLVGCFVTCGTTCSSASTASTTLKD